MPEESCGSLEEVAQVAADRFLEGCVAVGREFHLDGNIEGVGPQFRREIGAGGHAHGVFLRRYQDAVMALHGDEAVEQKIHVLARIGVMVIKYIDSHARHEALEITDKRPRIANTGDCENGVGARHPFKAGHDRSLVGENRLEILVGIAREKQLLIGEQLKVADKESIIKTGHGVGTLGHDYNVGAVDTSQGLAQASVGEHVVLVERMVELCEHDGGRRFHISMLESIVEQDEVDIRVKTPQLLNGLDAIFADSHRYLAIKFMVNLIGFVTDIGGFGVGGGEHKSLGLALVTTRKYRNMIIEPESLHEILDVWGLTRAAHGQIADGYHRNVKFVLRQDVVIKHLVAHIGNEAVKL